MRSWARYSLVGLLFLQTSRALPSAFGALAWLWQDQYGTGPHNEISMTSGPPVDEPLSSGAVASESAVCSQIGIDILKQGGNAADSMVATTLCVGVIASYHSGIGGGGFMLVRDEEGCYEFIDFRETAPAAATTNMFKNDVNASIYGGLASGVPGEISGLAYLHKHYGRLAWKDVVSPAVKIAHNGFVVTQDLLRFMNAAIKERGHNFFVEDRNWAIDFAPNGVLPRLGDTISRKRFARTLEKIARLGPKAFYKGKIADSIVKTVSQNGGILTQADLKNYKAVTGKVYNISYRDFRIYGGSAPSSGAVALSVMKIIEGYSDIGQTDSLNISTHRFDEALRFAYGQRSELGDPAFVDGIGEYEEDLFSTATAADIRGKINDYHTQNVSAYDPSGFESLETPGTSGIVTMDGNGLAVSLTTTVNLLFGSQIVDMETGIIMNNEMNDFSIPGISNAFGYIPSPNNYVEPGKRPLSSIVPTIVEHRNGTLYYLIAAAGGSRIITSTLQNVWNVLDRNMTAAQANAEPRLHDQLVPNVVTFEYTYNNDTVAFMKGRKHNITYVAPGQSATQSILRLANGSLVAAAESRQKNSGGFVWEE
ncbi:hypothetical protein AMS68_005545 [Peltaster fructicola]|uniref:Glutathione hydrolase n=1 Tax=Peltaster fructicola TaxID=286661 RepID=A0A6H0XZK5_9PEZI|nr:hypothetical protein AMS68_005545 [Peltaster fructicola]